MFWHQTCTSEFVVCISGFCSCFGPLFPLDAPFPPMWNGNCTSQGSLDSPKLCNESMNLYPPLFPLSLYRCPVEGVAKMESMYFCLKIWSKCVCHPKLKKKSGAKFFFFKLQDPDQLYVVYSCLIVITGIRSISGY